MARVSLYFLPLGCSTTFTSTIQDMYSEGRRLILGQTLSELLEGPHTDRPQGSGLTSIKLSSNSSVAASFPFLFLLDGRRKGSSAFLMSLSMMEFWELVALSESSMSEREADWKSGATRTAEQGN